MAGVNKAILIGHLGQDPEVTYSQSGLAIARLNLATSEKVKGEDRTEWHRVVCFDRLAEICGEYLSKGRQIYIEGRIQTRAWEDKEGVKRYTTEIVANSMQMLGSAQGGGGSPAPRPRAQENEAPRSAPPRAARPKPQAPADDPFTGDYGPPPTDDDIPF